MRLELNLSEKLYSKEGSNQFKPQFKSYGKIMRIIQNRVDRMMVYNVQRVDKRFQLSHIVQASQGVFVGDRAGRVFQLIESSFSNFVTMHLMRISAMHVDLERRILITASEARDIKVTDSSTFVTILHIRETPSAVRSFAKDNRSNLILTGQDNGFIVCYSLTDGQTQYQLKNSEDNSPIMSLALNSDSSIIFAGDKFGYIRVWDLETPLLIKTLNLNGASINYLLFNLDESAFYSADETGQVIMWDSVSYERIVKLGVNKSPITRLIIKQDLGLIFVSNAEGSIILWDLNTKALIKYFREFKLHGVKDFAVSPNGSQVYAVGYCDYVENWDFSKNAIVSRSYTNEVYDNENYVKAFSTAKELFCISETNNVLVYNIILQTGKAELREQFMLPTDVEVTSFVVHEELPYMYIGCEDGCVRIWNYAIKEFVELLDCRPHSITAMSLNTQGTVLLCGDTHGRMHIWNTSSYAKLKEFEDLSDSNVSPVAFLYMTQDGLSLILGKANGIMQLLDIETGNLINQYTESYMGEFSQFCKAKNADILYTVNDTRALIKWTILNDTIVAKMVFDKDSLCITSLVCNSTGTLVFMSNSDFKVRVFDDSFHLPQSFNVRTNADIFFMSMMVDGSALLMLAPDGALNHVTIVPKTKFEFLSKTTNSISTCIAADMDNVYVGNQNGSIDVWSLSTKDLFFKYTTKSSRVNCMLLSSRGRYLYTGHEDGSLAIWNTENYTFIREFQEQRGGITSIIMNSDQRLMLTSGKDNNICIWDLRNYSIRKRISTPFEPEQIMLSAEDKYLTVKLVTGQVAFYNLQGENMGYTGNRSATLRSIALSRDGNKMYMAYEDSPIQIWDMSDFESIGTLYKTKAPIEYMTISHDGNRMYIITRDGVLSEIDINAKCLVKEIAFNEPFNCNFIYISKRKNMLFGLGTNKAVVVDIYDSYSYYEKLYINKALMNYNSLGAENEFTRALEYTKEHYNKSFVLRTYFNAVFICAMFNYQSAIQIIQNKHLSVYPQNNDHNQISPIVLALKLRNYNLVQLILKSIAKNPNDFVLTYKEIKELLKAKYGFTHKYIKNFMINLKTFTDSTLKVPTLSKIDEKIRMEYDLNSYFTERRYERMTEPRHLYEKKNKVDFDKALKVIKDSFGRATSTEVVSNDLRKHLSFNPSVLKAAIEEDKPEEKVKQNKAPWRPTKLYRLNAYYSFKEGSSDSIYFLKNYVDSDSSDFILSNWRFIIDYKWDLVYWYLMPAAIMNFSHVVLYSLYLINPFRYPIFLAEAIVMGALIFYELLSLIITGKEHFDDFYNVLDSIFLGSTVAIFVLTRYLLVIRAETDLEWLKYLQVLTLFMVYYRSVTYLRLIKYFRHLIDMIVGVASSTISLLIIIAYTIAAVAVMFTKSIRGFSFLSYLKDTFYGLNGQLVDYTDEKREVTILGWIVYTIYVFFLPLILINFLIAKMSNKYTELEANEKVTSYREKAKMIMEIEFFFRIRRFARDYKYFVFIARDASKINEEDDNVGDKIEDNIENIYQKINDVKNIHKKEIKKAKKRQKELKKQIKAIIAENDHLKNQLHSIKDENVDLKNIIVDRNALLETKLAEIDKKLLTLNTISDMDGNPTKPIKSTRHIL